MGFLGFGRRADTYLVAVTFEGKGRLRLNGNHVRSGRKSKDHAASHTRTVCWIEFAPDGAKQDGGSGPMATCLEAGGVERLLRELPQTLACRQVLEEMRQGKPSACKWLAWGESSSDIRGPVSEQR